MQESAEAEVLLDVRDVHLTFGQGENAVIALSGVDMSVRKDEFVCVVGPSGCGKTTLLRAAAGLQKVTSGSMSIAGNPVTGPREDAGIVFQRPVLLAWATILENLLLPARLQRVDMTSARERANELLRLVDLTGFEKHYPNQLSGGMQQRASIARALMLDPSILLMDEPFGALDALTRQTMNSELTRIWQERRKTVLLITHDIHEAVVLADRVLVMKARPGRVVAEFAIDLPRPRGGDSEYSAQVDSIVREIEKELGL